MAESFNVSLETFLQPSYWNGHSIGYGDEAILSDYEKEYDRDVITTALVRFAERGGFTGSPSLESFGYGQTFDPNDYEPGVLVRPRFESLIAPRAVTVDFDSINEAPPPPEPLINPKQKIAISEVILTDEDEKIHYTSLDGWGVITTTARGNGLFRVQRELLVTQQTNFFTKVKYGIRGARINPITMGEVEHKKSGTKPYPKLETVTRIRYLDVCGNGLIEKRREGAVGWLRRFGLASS